MENKLFALKIFFKFYKLVQKNRAFYIVLAFF